MLLGLWLTLMHTVAAENSTKSEELKRSSVDSPEFAKFYVVYDFRLKYVQHVHSFIWLPVVQVTRFNFNGYLLLSCFSTHFFDYKVISS